MNLATIQNLFLIVNITMIGHIIVKKMRLTLRPCNSVSIIEMYFSCVKFQVVFQEGGFQLEASQALFQAAFQGGFQVVFQGVSQGVILVIFFLTFSK